MNWPGTLSLRARLTLQWTCAFGVVLALANLALFAATRSFQRSDLDAQVRTLAATELSSAVDECRGVHLHEFPFAPLAGADYAEKFAQVIGPGGGVVQSSYNLLGVPPLLADDVLTRARAGEPALVSAWWNGTEIRMLATRTEWAGVTYVMGVGLSTDAMRRTLARVAWMLTGMWVLGLAVTALLGFALASRALAPVDHVTRRAAAIARGDFAARLDPPAHDDEMGRMTRLLNEMLERLHGAIEANRRFAADASHELRTPLTVIAGEVDVALRRDRDPAEYRETLALVRDQLRQMTELTENLMVLVRGQERSSDRLIHEVPLQPLIEAAVARLAEAAASRGISVSSSGFAQTVVYGDERLFARVFDNLLANAVHYNRDGGYVRVEVRCEEANATEWAPDLVVTRVTNSSSGTPIPAADWEVIFERFRRLDVSRSRRTGGTGLGLSICRAIVTLFNGTIRVAASDDVSTTFEVALPGRREAARPTAPTPASCAARAATT